jgi:predicted small metal-binding protein
VTDDFNISSLSSGKDTRRDAMGRVLKCSDVHLGCKFEVRGETEEEILRQHAEHAKKEHKLTEIRPEDWESARKAIREEVGRKTATR